MNVYAPSAIHAWLTGLLCHLSHPIIPTKQWNGSISSLKLAVELSPHSPMKRTVSHIWVHFIVVNMKPFKKVTWLKKNYLQLHVKRKVWNACINNQIRSIVLVYSKSYFISIWILILTILIRFIVIVTKSINQNWIVRRLAVK
jgi:hypothetical protein